MNDQWKEYVDGMRTGFSPYSTRSVDRLLKLVDAQDAVVKALEQRKFWQKNLDAALRAQHSGSLCGDTVAFCKASVDEEERALNSALRALSNLKLE